MWVIQRINDGKFVSKPEITAITGSSYTRGLKNAMKFKSKEDAVANSCVENEKVIKIDPYEYFK
jgi:hypothetical protein